MAQAQATSVTYTWEGTNKQGKIVRGELMAKNPEAVKVELRKLGVTPKSGKIRKKGKSLFGGGGGGKKIKTGDIAVFSRQLATMLKAGVPLVQSFDIVGQGHSNPNMAKLIMAIKNDVEAGSTLANSLRPHYLYFDDLFVNLVDAGEQSGALEDLLEKVATYKKNPKH